MLWIWVLALVTVGILVWFGMQVFSGGVSPKTNNLTGDSGNGTGGGTGAHSSGAVSSTTDDAEAGSASSGGSASSTSSASSSGVGAVAAAGAAAAVAAGGVAAARASSRPSAGATSEPIVYENVTSGSDISAAGNGKTGLASGDSNALSSSDAQSVREMIKILNLRESDASRLGIDAAEFSSLCQGAADSVNASTLTSVHSRLQHMLN